MRISDSERAGQIREELRQHRLKLTSGGYFMVTGTFKGEETKWQFGSAVETHRLGAERRKERLEGMYPGEVFKVEDVSEDNIDLPVNHMFEGMVCHG